MSKGRFSGVTFELRCVAKVNGGRGRLLFDFLLGMRAGEEKAVTLRGSHPGDRTGWTWRCFSDASDPFLGGVCMCVVLGFVYQFIFETGSH